MTGRRSGHCPQVELAVGWALHALERSEEAAVAAHLSRCHECSTIVRDTEEAATLVALTVTEQPLPPALRERLMAEVSARDDQPEVPRDQGSPSPDEPGREVPSRGFRLLPTPQAPRASRVAASVRWRRRVGVLVAAAAVLLAAVGGLTARTLQLEHQRNAAASQSEQLLRVLVAADQPGMHHALLATPAGQPVAVVLDDGQHRVLVPIGLSQNTVAHTIYVLWGTEAGPPVALAAFDVSAGQGGRVPVSPDSEAGHFQGYAISLEPGRTMPAKPSHVVASGQVVS